MKKKYKHPIIQGIQGERGIVPLAAVGTAVGSVVAVGASLAGGYAIGRSVKQVFEIRLDDKRDRRLRKVLADV